jgi:hypothetical protein
MRSPSRMGGCSALIAAATLTGLLAGCASASSGAMLTTAHAGDLGPVAGSRALAVASAQRLLGLLVLPAGSRRLPARPVPQSLSQPGVSIGGPGNFLDRDRLYRLPMTVAHAIAFLRAHEPRGTVNSGTGGGGTSDGVTITAIAFTKRRVSRGINQIVLVETLTPGAAGSSLLRADAQVVWYPPRSAAEYLIAARLRSVRITLTSSDRTDSVQGGQRFIRPLAAVLDSMHATPPLRYPCPTQWLTYKLAFAPAVPAQQAVIVTSESCGADQVSVGGRLQPELFDTGRLTALVTRLHRILRGAHVKSSPTEA